MPRIVVASCLWPKAVFWKLNWHRFGAEPPALPRDVVALRSWTLRGVALVWALFRGVRPGETRERPEAILRSRYASGEIDTDEFERRLSTFERAETPHNLPSSVRVVPAFKPRAARNAPARGQSRRPRFSRECIDRNRADGGRALAAQRNSYTRKLPRSSAFVAGFVITGA